MINLTQLPQGVQVMVSAADMLDLMQQLIRKEVYTKNEEALQAQFLSPEKTRKLFDPEVSLVTLNVWAKRGFLKKHYIGGRTYYKYAEVMEAVKNLKKYQRKDITTLKP